MVMENFIGPLNKKRRHSTRQGYPFGLKLKTKSRKSRKLKTTDDY